MLTINDKNELEYKCKVVGTIDATGAKPHLKLDLEFDVQTPEDWIVVLSHLATVLAKVAPPLPSPDFIFETAADEVDEVFGARVTLEEKNVSAGGQKWQFHKTDVDDWPSKLHGHSGRQKVDAITGEIFDVNTRQQCGKLNKKALARLQGELRGHKDFPRAATLLPAPTTRAGRIIESLEKQQRP